MMSTTEINKGYSIHALPDWGLFISGQVDALDLRDEFDDLVTDELVRQGVNLYGSEASELCSDVLMMLCLL